jgi:hypothetical protein
MKLSVILFLVAALGGRAMLATFSVMPSDVRRQHMLECRNRSDRNGNSCSA